MAALVNPIKTNNFKIFLGLLLGVDQIHDFTDEGRLAKERLMTVLFEISTVLDSPAPAAPAAAASGGSPLVRTDTEDTVKTEKANTMDAELTADLRAQPYFPEFNANLKIIFISYLFSIKFWDYNYTDPTEKQFQEMIPSNLEDEEDLGDKKDLEDEKTKYTKFLRLFFFRMLPSVWLPPDLDNINKLIYLFKYLDKISKKFFFPVIVQNIISTFKTGGMMRTHRERVDSERPYPKFAERSAAKKEAQLAAKGEAEDALRASGVEYTIVRPAGALEDGAADGSGALTEGAGVGAGSRLRRGEAAALVCRALFSDRAAGKTVTAVAADALGGQAPFET